VSKTLIIRYQTSPEAASENSRLVEEVYASLAELQPPDLSYRTYRLADGVTFVHIARLDGPGNPLTTLPAFAEFQRELSARCVTPPEASPADLVGAYTPMPPAPAT
jgi:hypothetical protein